MTEVFAYLRVSGKSQVRGDGFRRQFIAIRQYCAAHQLHIVRIFKERGVSGTKELDDRPALSELFAALEEDGIKSVVVEKLDRMARDLMVQETIMADMQKHGYTLLSTAEPDLCSRDPSRVLIRQIFGALAQWERAMIVMKLRGARQRKKARGERARAATPTARSPARKLSCSGFSPFSRLATQRAPSPIFSTRRAMQRAWASPGNPAPWPRF